MYHYRIHKISTVSYTMNNHSFDLQLSTSHPSHPANNSQTHLLDMEAGVAQPVTCCCNTSWHGVGSATGSRVQGLKVRVSRESW